MYIKKGFRVSGLGFYELGLRVSECRDFRVKGFRIYLRSGFAYLSFPFAAFRVQRTPPKNHALNSSACHQRQEAVAPHKQWAGILIKPSSHEEAQEKLWQHSACPRSCQNCHPWSRNLQAWYALKGAKMHDHKRKRSSCKSGPTGKPLP